MNTLRSRFQLRKKMLEATEERNFGSVWFLYVNIFDKVRGKTDGNGVHYSTYFQNNWQITLL